MRLPISSDLFRPVLTLTAAVLSQVLVSASARADTTLDTRTGPNLFYWHCCDRVDGQVFRAPTDRYLQTVSLWQGSYYGTSIPLRGILQAWASPTGPGQWGGGSVTGPILWESDERVLSGSGPTRLEFDLGGIELVPGQSYVFFSLASAYLNGYTFAGDGWLPTSTIGGGAHSGTTSPTWQQSYDAAFVATFTSSSATPIASVPEPSGWTLLGTGLIALGGAVARRRRQT